MRFYSQQRTIIQLWILALVTAWGCDQNLSEELNKATEPVNMQIPEFKGTLVAESGSSTNARQAESRLTPLDEAFSSYQVYALGVAKLSSYVSSGSSVFNLNLSATSQWQIALEASDLMAENYQSYVYTESGMEESTEVIGNIFYKGTTADGGKVRLTLEGHIISGFIRYEDEEIFIESASELGVESSVDEIVVYRSEDIITNEDDEFICEVENEVANEVGKAFDHVNARSNNTCSGIHVVKVATLASYARYKKHFGSSVHKTNKRILEIINSAQANYDEFDIHLKVVEQQVVTCESCMPFDYRAGINNDDDIFYSGLSKFLLWDWDGGFLSSNDIGLMFVEELQSRIWGRVSQIDGICTVSAYALVRHIGDKTKERVTMAHEIGHIFGAEHVTSSPNIMNRYYEKPGNNKWLTESKNIINKNKTRECLQCLELGDGWLLYRKGSADPEVINTSASVASKVKIGDFNGDGEDDVIRLLDHSTQGPGWYIKYSGRGAWIKVFTSGAAMDKVSIGDFDGDGEDDVITVFGTGMPDGPGWYVSYSAKTIWFKVNDTISASPAFRVGDFNGDGVSDLIQRFNYEELSEGSLKGYHISYGNIGRNAHKQWERVNGITWDLNNTFVGDFDGDGKDDLFTKVTLHWNVMYAASGFQSWVKMKESNYNTDRLKIGDFNGDGQADLMTFRGLGSSTGRGWAVVYSGLGRWTRLNDAIGLDDGLEKLQIGDFDGDGISDILYFNND